MEMLIGYVGGKETKRNIRNEKGKILAAFLLYKKNQAQVHMESASGREASFKNRISKADAKQSPSTT